MTRMWFVGGFRVQSAFHKWRKLPKIIPWLMAYAVGVYLVEQGMSVLGFFHNQQAVWWPTNGIALGLLMRTDRRHWLLIMASTLCGSVIGEIQYGLPLSWILFNGLANLAGPLLGALTLARFRQLEEWLLTPHVVLRFVGCGLVLSPLVSAIILATYRSVYLDEGSFWGHLQLRCVSDMLGYALLTPLVLVVSEWVTNRVLIPRKVVGPFLSIVGLVIWVSAVFWQSTYSLTFVAVSFTLMATIRYGFSVSVISLNILAVIATAASMSGHGPFVLGGGVNVTSRVLLLQGFLILTMTTVMSVSVIQLERKVFQDRMKNAYDEMARTAETDSLTGLKNRRFIEAALSREWKRALRDRAQLALLMVDVDYFKLYNDSYGHVAGDDCLRAVAEVLSRGARRPADIVARYGGEEFMCILPNTDVRGAFLLAESLRRQIEALSERPHSTLKCSVTVSVGCVAATPSLDSRSESLVETADQALYRAKHNGRNRVETAEVQSSALVRS
jgi:diguanylate cyclase (GGDEF)-like protein